MRILFQNKFNNLQSSKQVTFGNQILYHKLKHIKNIPCACCGNKTLHSNKLCDVFGSLSKPLSYHIENGAFAWYEKNYPPIYNFLCNLAKFNPNQSLDRILKKEKNHFDLFNTIIKTIKFTNGGYKAKQNPELAEKLEKDVSKTFHALIKHGRKFMRNSEFVIKKLQPFKQYLHGRKLAVFEQLAAYSKKYPEKTLHEIICQTSDVYKYHSYRDFKQQKFIKNKIDFHFSNIEKIVEDYNPKLVGQLNELKEKTLLNLSYIDDKMARIPVIKKMYSEFLNANNCSSIVSEVNKELDRLPRSANTVDSFFVFAKSKKMTDGTVLNSIFTPVQSSTYYLPLGKKSLTNSLVFCRKCHQNSSNFKFAEVLEYHPEMTKNIQKQFDVVTKLILEGKVEDNFRLWPLNMTELLDKISLGKLKIDISKYIENQKNITESKCRNHLKSRELIHRKFEQRQHGFYKFENDFFEPTEISTQSGLKSFSAKNIRFEDL